MRFRTETAINITTNHSQGSWCMLKIANMATLQNFDFMFKKRQVRYQKPTTTLLTEIICIILIYKSYLFLQCKGKNT